MRTLIRPNLPNFHRNSKYALKKKCFRPFTSNHGPDRQLADHREIGFSQNLFMIDPSAPGMVFFLPHGKRIIDSFKALLRYDYSKNGYQEVSSPLLYSSELWKRSGHYQNYSKHMFMIQGGIEDEYQNDIESNKSNIQNPVNTSFGLKPMNCPAHCLMYKSSQRSYRELPIRFADFSSLHRNEFSGSLGGLTRLRQFHQDDAHIFCLKSQVSQEILNIMSSVQRLYLDVFKFKDYKISLSTRPEHYLGSESDWNEAENVLYASLNEFGKKWEISKADGAFYGPKIDIQVLDHLNREHQLATIQLDFQLPSRFDLEYVDDQAKYQKPVLIHRAVMGSLERFLALYSEQCQGNWPFWCSPRQVQIIPIYKGMNNSAIDDFVRKIQTDLQFENPNNPFSERFHVDTDFSDDTLKSKIFKAQALKYNYTIVVGQKELETGVLSVRSRDDQKNLQQFSIEDFKQEMSYKKANLG